MDLLKYIPDTVPKTEKEFITERAEAIELLCKARGLTDANAWNDLQGKHLADPNDEKVKKSMFLISTPLAFSEAAYLFSINRFPGRKYIEYINRALFAIDVAIETYTPETMSFKYHVEQCLHEVMEDLPQETIGEEK